MDFFFFFVRCSLGVWLPSSIPLVGDFLPTVFRERLNFGLDLTTLVVAPGASLEVTLALAPAAFSVLEAELYFFTASFNSFSTFFFNFIASPIIHLFSGLSL